MNPESLRVQHAGSSTDGGGHMASNGTSDLESVRRRIKSLQSARVSMGFTADEQAEYADLLARERQLLRERHSGSVSAGLPGNRRREPGPEV